MSPGPSLLKPPKLGTIAKEPRANLTKPKAQEGKEYVEIKKKPTS